MLLLWINKLKLKLKLRYALRNMCINFDFKSTSTSELLKPQIRVKHT